jgi:hypothetical protein
MRWPPPDDGPDILDDYPIEWCRRAIMSGKRRIRPLPVSTHANGITSISPSTVCAGHPIDINGSGFGAAKPADITVVIGTRTIQVDAWSDNRITITVPVGSTSGCVGFRNETIEAERLQIHAHNEQIRESIASECSNVWPHIPYAISPPPCTGFNLFEGTRRK